MFSSREGRVYIAFTNTSKQPYRLDDTKVNLWTNDGMGYGLSLIENTRTSIINPGEMSLLVAEINNPPTLSKLKGFTLISRGEPNIRFGYQEIGWWNRLRWWLAEGIRK